MQAGNESDAVSIASSQNNVMSSRHVTCGLIEAMVDGELRYIIGERSDGGMGSEPCPSSLQGRGASTKYDGMIDASS